ncbi:MAG: beta-lactamase family protein [Clostridia bacterium]|nr:beta-lactamase family protein [Clostridia bacterium]
MPVGTLKNTVYGALLPLAGKRCDWKPASDVEKVLKHHCVPGAAIQTFEKGNLSSLYTVGWAGLDGKKRPVTSDSFFRTASIAKTIAALLVFRLQTLKRLNVHEDISDLLGYSVRNPLFPQKPVTVGMVLSHTSSLNDSPAYFASFDKPEKLETLLKDDQAFVPYEPGQHFRYSNLAAGMIACMLEHRFSLSFEALAQQELFEPLGIKATFDLNKLQTENVADSWRVLPAGLAFDAENRKRSAKPLNEPDPQRHYLLASGNLYLTAETLARLTLLAWNGGNGFLDEASLLQMKTPVLGWPDQTVRMRHGMGLFQLDDRSVCSRTLWGHQGFAYGAVNGLFFDVEGNGFVCLNSGASERRIGHLACLNRDLIGLLMKESK